VSNLIIEKTSSEEGRYGEVIAECFYKYYTEFGSTSPKYKNISLSDTTKDKAYQKIDCDFHDKNADIKIEVKHDTWIAGKKKNYPNGTGNIPYEIATHIPYDLGKTIEAYATYRGTVTLNELLEKFPELHERYIGCNEKCKADDIFAVGGEEENEENRRYKLIKIWNINNERFQKYAHAIQIRSKAKRKNSEEWLHFPWQKEDNGYNIIINVPIKKLIEFNIAREMPEFMINKMKMKFPALDEYHTSKEIEKIITTF